MNWHVHLVHGACRSGKPQHRAQATLAPSEYIFGRPICKVIAFVTPCIHYYVIHLCFIIALIDKFPQLSRCTFDVFRMDEKVIKICGPSRYDSCEAQP